MLLTLIVSVGNELQFTDREDQLTTGLLAEEQGTVMAPWRHGLTWVLVGVTPSIQFQLLQMAGELPTVHICDFYPASVENDDGLLMVGYVERVDRYVPW